MDGFSPYENQELRRAGISPAECRDPDKLDDIGWGEAGSAARTIIERCREHGTWQCGFYVGDFEPQIGLIGFCMLCCWGWIVPGYPNGRFMPTMQFVKFVTRKADK